MSPIKIAGSKSKEPGIGEKEAKVPNVKVNKQGKVDKMLTDLVKLYEQNNPGKKGRWVYSPLHRPELSNVLGRQAQGFKIVKVEELGEELFGFSSDDQVRVGDLLLMGVEKEIMDSIREELEERATEQAASVDRRFYEEMEGVKVPAPDGSYHGAKARGKVSVEEKLHEYDIEQRTSED